MQRLEIVYRANVVWRPAPLTDTAGHWDISVRNCDDVTYLVADGFNDAGDSLAEHVVPFDLVLSASARNVEELQQLGENPS